MNTQRLTSHYNWTHGWLDIQRLSREPWRQYRHGPGRDRAKEGLLHASRRTKAEFKCCLNGGLSDVLRFCSMQAKKAVKAHETNLCFPTKGGFAAGIP
jgi:hypothetical protein